MSGSIAFPMPNLAEANGSFEIIIDSINPRYFNIKHSQSGRINVTKLLLMDTRFRESDRSLVPEIRSDSALSLKLNKMINRWLKSKRTMRLIRLISQEESIPLDQFVMKITDDSDDFNGIYVNESLRDMLMMELAPSYTISISRILRCMHG